jgi:uncharacterized lipoprotein YehR (DUF1307 family)
VDDDSDDNSPLEDDPTVTTFGENPAISIIKTGVFNDGGDGVADVDDEITYTYTVANEGNVTLNNVTVTELPGIFTGTGILPTPSFVSASLGSLVGSLMVGETATYTATYAITQADINAGQVDNQALAEGDSPMGTTVDDNSDDDSPFEDDVTIVQIPEDPAISIVKTSSFNDGGDGVANVGDVITYTYLVANEGNVTLSSVVVNEIAGNFTGTGTLPTPSFVSSSFGSLVGNLIVGETASYTATYAVTQADINAGQVDNQALAEGESPMGNTVEDDSDDNSPLEDDPTITPLDEDPAISLVKTSSFNDGGDGVANVGDVITYTYLVANEGNVSLSNVMVNELPGIFTGTGALPTPSFVSSSFGSLVGNLIVGETATYTATYAVTQADIDAGFVDNQALAQGDSPMGTTVEDDSDDNSPFEDDPTNTPLDEDPAISIVKTSSFDDGGDGEANVGDVITYTYLVANEGNVTLNNVAVNELAGIFTGTGTLSVPGFVSSSLGSLVGNLLVGESATYTATYAITQADINSGNVTNQALAVGDSPTGTTVDDDSDDNSPLEDDPTVTPLTENPAISLVKTSSFNDGGDGEANVGDIITYTYTSTNEGNVTLTGVNVTEVPGNFSGTGLLPAPSFVSSSLGSSIGTMLVGENSTWTATYAITQADINAGTVDNQAFTS